MSSKSRSSHDAAATRPATAILSGVIARRFYEQGRSKSEIAEEFGLSRFKVARMLDAARESGLVRVEFELPAPLDLTLSDELANAYGLRRALVLERAPQESSEKLRGRIGTMAADLLSEITTSHDVLGLAWARTVNTMTASLRTLARCPVVQLCGVYSRMDFHDRSVETIQRATAVSGGAAYPIFGPLVLLDRRTADTLRRQPGIAEAFDRFDDITKAVVSIGAWQPGLSTVYDVLGERDRAAIADRGVAAEVAARLFDTDGNEVATGLSHYVLAITTAQLRQVDDVIALASGDAKAPAVDAVLRSGMVTTLITDAGTARALLDLAARRPVPGTSAATTAATAATSDPDQPRK